MRASHCWDPSLWRTHGENYFILVVVTGDDQLIIMKVIKDWNECENDNNDDDDDDDNDDTVEYW